MPAVFRALSRARLLSPAALQVGRGTSDPYVVLTLLDREAKSRVLKKTLDPEWNETLSFSGVTSALDLAEALLAPVRARLIASPDLTACRPVSARGDAQPPRAQAV